MKAAGIFVFEVSNISNTKGNFLYKDLWDNSYLKPHNELFNTVIIICTIFILFFVMLCVRLISKDI
jgi:hypothetical protein